MTTPTPDATGKSDQVVPEVAGTPMSTALFSAARVHRIAAGNLLRDTGLYPGQELLMMRLWREGEQRQADLIKTLGLDPSTVTKMLKRLEQSGFVTRAQSATDRRAVVVRPTRAGQALRERVEQAWRELEKATTAGLTREERDIVMRLLGHITENLTFPSPGAQPGGSPAAAAPPADHSSAD
ncbi:MarR family winged helix-turn-helix transcriptional regulator [Streptomyces sp. bgisy084]|uniref:MarR family winged helix-turn-helix transcriptional regulator n=1 Tax=unclassified Streptomyces TaxID=2593676 RepID=UPI003D73396B